MAFVSVIDFLDLGRANNGVSGPCRRTWLHAPALVVVGAINGLACAGPAAGSVAATQPRLP
jgi:hypothetical protein